MASPREIILFSDGIQGIKKEMFRMKRVLALLITVLFTFTAVYALADGPGGNPPNGNPPDGNPPGDPPGGGMSGGPGGTPPGGFGGNTAPGG